MSLPRRVARLLAQLSLEDRTVMIKLANLLKRPVLALGLVSAAAGLAWAGHLNAVLEAQLDGREEVASGATNSAIVGDPDGRGEIYVFGVDGDPTTLCYVLIVKKIGELSMAPGGGRAAHIHVGPRGVNGPVVANLAWPQNGQAGDCLTEGEGAGTAGVKFPGNPPGIVQQILTNPTEYYVNVHNAEYPAGAIRGQLSAVENH
jgi:hypothetical protein